MRPRLLASLATVVAALVLAPAASAADATCDRFAAPDGSDTAAGTATSPFRTVPRLVESLSAGDTGCLRTGTYAETANGYIARFGRAGTADAPITLRSHPGERARVVGIVMVASGADHVHLAELDIVGSGESNTIKVYAADVVISDNDITNELRGDSCMILGSSSGGRAVRPIVQRNVFHDCGSAANGNKDHGIYAAKVDDGEIVDNTFSNSLAYAIQLYPDAQRNHVAGNVIDGGADTVRGGIVIGGDTASASSGNVVERNVISHTVTQGVFSYWPSAVGADNLVRDNCFWRTDDEVGGDGGLAVAGNVVADPGYADRAGRDYRLGDASPCRAIRGGALADSDVVDGGLSDPQLGSALEIDRAAFSASSSSFARGPVGCAGRSRASCRSRR